MHSDPRRNDAKAGADVPLDADERARYHRHLILDGFGERAQMRLREATVLVVGMGGLGSPAALYLAAAGVGRLVLVDDDTVDVTNLQRQVLYADDDVGRPKAECAARRLAALNPRVRLEAHVERLGADTALARVRDCDVVLDGTDNFATRFLLNDACVLEGRPYVYGSIHRFEGQVAVFATPGGPCYRCLFPEPPPPDAVPDCAQAGVLGVLPGIVGVMQATAAIELLAGIGDPPAGRLVMFDALAMRMRSVALARDPACPVCGDAPTIRTLAESAARCAPAGRDASAPPERNAGARDDGSPAERDAGGRDDRAREATPDSGAVPEIDARALKARLEAGHPPLQLVDVREPHERALTHIGGELIPMHEIPYRLDAIARDRDVVVYCRTGSRSGQVVAWLRREGFDNVYNLRGGLHAWSREVDPSVPRY